MRYMFGLSVVIPTFNRSVELLRAVNSVAAHPLMPVEIVVVDDCSHTNPATVLSNTNSQGVPIRLYRLSVNKGAQSARNLGIRRARFSYIAFLDSDDQFSLEKINFLYDLLKEQSVDVVFHAVEGMPFYGKLASAWSVYLSRFLSFSWLLTFYNPVLTPALVVKKKRVLGVPSMRHSEDWAYLIHYVTPKSKVIYIDIPLSKVYRPVGQAGGLSATYRSMRRGEFKARRIILRNLNASNILRYVLGSMVGLLRVVNDFARGRYKS